MIGWHTALSPRIRRAPEKNVTGVVISKNFPDSQMIREKLEEGIKNLPPDTLWVMREKPAADHACSIAWAVLREHGIEPIHAGPVSCFANGREWADAEMRQTCYRILVFHDGRSETTKSWQKYSWWNDPYEEGKYPCRARIFVITRGKKTAKRKASKRVET